MASDCPWCEAFSSTPVDVQLSDCAQWLIVAHGFHGFFRRAMSGQQYLVIYNVVLSLLIAILTGLCVWQPKTSAVIEYAFVYIVIGLWCMLALGNAIFVVAKCRSRRHKYGTVSFVYQLLVFGSLIPWVGLILYRRFQL